MDDDFIGRLNGPNGGLSIERLIVDAMLNERVRILCHEVAVSNRMQDGAPFEDEIPKRQHASLLHNSRGVLSMATSLPNTNKSQLCVQSRRHSVSPIIIKRLVFNYCKFTMYKLSDPTETSEDIPPTDSLSIRNNTCT